MTNGRNGGDDDDDEQLFEDDSDDRLTSAGAVNFFSCGPRTDTKAGICCSLSLEIIIIGLG
jgi:hypothetical protein